MKTQEMTDILNKLSLDEFPYGWLPNCRQILVQTATLEIPIPIDVGELDGLSDGKIKKLIQKRIISTLEDRLSFEKEKVENSFINR